MPPRARIHDINESSIGQWFSRLPVVTRTLLVCYLVTGLLGMFDLMPWRWIWHQWSKELSLPIPQVWRWVTNFLVVGTPSINYLFQLVWLVQYGAAYETAKFLGNTADALTMLGCGMIFMLTLDGLLPSLFYASFHGQAIVFMLLYLWSKNSPSTQVSFFGVIKFQALYLPFALLFLDVVQGANPMHGIRGILAGHMYYFLTEIYPSTSGRHLISTPLWLSRFVYRHGLGKVPVQQARPEHPSSAGFRAFSGRSHRLS